MIQITIGKNDKGQRLDRFLKKYFDAAPLSMIYKMVRKDVKVNGRRAKEAALLEEGDLLTVYISEDQAREFHTDRGAREKKRISAARQFKVAYEDDEMIIVSKPFGLLTHGDRTEKKNTLANQVAGYLQEKGEYDPAAEQTFRPSPVNRLDRNTTGLVIFGKTAEATRRLAEEIRTRDGVSKYYLTIVSGHLSDEMVLDGALVKDEATNTVNVYSQGSKLSQAEAAEQTKTAVTIVRPVAWSNQESQTNKGDLKRAENRIPKKKSEGFTLIEAELVTGRTHQIRAHLAQAGFPIIGDAKYGDRRVNKIIKEKFGLTTQLLHAARLEFEDKGGIMKVTAPLPKRFEEIKIALFGKDN